MTRFARVFRYAIAAAILAATIGSFSTSLPAATIEPARSALGFTISPETTFFTGPLNADGGIDVNAALNERYGQGITPEKNAYVLIIEALGASEKMLGPNYKETLRLVGAKESAGCWHLFFPDDQWDPDKRDRRDATQHTPWKAEDYPDIDRWITENAAALEIIERAAKRERLWAPVTPSVLYIKSTSSAWNRISEFCYALRSRAMKRLAMNDSQGALEDLLTVHRLARLLLQQQGFRDQLTAHHLERETWRSDEALLQAAGNNAEIVRGLMQEMQALPPINDLEEAIRLDGHASFVDLIQQMARGEAAAAAKHTPGVDVEKTAKALSKLGLMLPDWDLALRHGHKLIDDLAATPKYKNAEELSAWYKALDDKFAAISDRMKDEKSDKLVMQARPGETREAYTIRFSEWVVSMSLPSMVHMRKIQLHNTLARQLMITGCALELYHQDHGAYPETLAALVPAYIAETPLDWYGKPVEYSQTPGGYLMVKYGFKPESDKRALVDSRDTFVQINRK